MVIFVAIKSPSARLRWYLRISWTSSIEQRAALGISQTETCKNNILTSVTGGRLFDVQVSKRTRWAIVARAKNDGGAE